MNGCKIELEAAATDEEVTITIQRSMSIVRVGLPGIVNILPKKGSSSLQPTYRVRRRAAKPWKNYLKDGKNGKRVQ